AVGYANIADEYDIIGGTKDDLFQPNKPITRAQMATVLDRTYDKWLEEEGAQTVQGELVNHDEEERLLTLNSEEGETDYSYGEDFSVSFEGSYIGADQLEEGDILSLQLIDNEIEDASVIAEETEESVSGTKLNMTGDVGDFNPSEDIDDPTHDPALIEHDGTY
ncbi:S-layer homology domain-containing protein, partial [Salibacterium salarium]